MLRGLETLRQMVGSRSAAPPPRARATRTPDLAGGKGAGKGAQARGKSGAAGQQASEGVPGQAWSPDYGAKRKREVNGKGMQETPSPIAKHGDDAGEEQPRETRQRQSKARRGGGTARLDSAGTLQCPLCGKGLPASNELLNSHIDACLLAPCVEPKAAATSTGHVTGISRVSTPKSLPRKGGCATSTPASVVDNVASSRATRLVQMTFSRSATHEGGAQREALHLQAPRQLARAIPLRSSSPAADSAAITAGSTEVTLAEPDGAAEANELRSWIVGRRYGSQQPLPKGTAVLAVRERHNPKDANAVQIWTSECRGPPATPPRTPPGPPLSGLVDKACAGAAHEAKPGRLLGHLPRAVAAKVAPMLDVLGRPLQGHVLGTPRNASARASIALRAPIELSADQQFQLLAMTPADSGPDRRAERGGQKAGDSDLAQLWGEAMRASERGEGSEPWRGANQGAAAAAGGVEGQTETTCVEGRTGVVQDGRGLRGGAGYAERLVEVVHQVLARDSHLLSAEELELLRTILGLPEGARRLLVRLLMRRGPWFRVASLAYPEVPDVAAAAAALVESLLCSDGTSGPDPHQGTGGEGPCRQLPEGQRAEGEGSSSAGEAGGQLSREALREVVGTLLRSDELCQLAKTHGLLRSAECNRSSKDELAAALLGGLDNAPAHRVTGLAADVGSALGGPVLRVSDAAREAFNRVQRLFFLSETQSVSSLILSDIGSRTYPHYVCSASTPVFASREDLLDYEQALECGREMEEAVTGDDADTVQGVLHRCLGRLGVSQEEGRAGASQEEGKAEGSEGGSKAKALQGGKGIEAAQGPSSDASESAGLLAIRQVPARPVFAQRFCAGEVLATAVTVGVSWLEKQHRYAEASSVLRRLLSLPFCEGRRGHWWLRLSVNLGHQRQPDAGLAAAEEGVEDWRVKGGDLLALQRRVVRLGRPPRRWKAPRYAPGLKWKCAEVRILGRPLNRDGSRSRFYGIGTAEAQGTGAGDTPRAPRSALEEQEPWDGGSGPVAVGGAQPPRGSALPGPEEQCHVEELALQHYASQQGGLWEGLHAEGSVWRTLFGLCFWDIVFGPASVEGVFRHPFQTAPLDFGTPGFFAARREPIEARLQQIRDGAAVALAQRTWAQHHGTLAPCVAWEGSASLEQLCAIAEGVGGTGLASVLGLLAQDLGFWSSGMPDLVLWRRRPPQGPSGLPCEGPAVEVKLVEVKGPRDVLSDQQHYWLRFLAERGVCAEVCKIVEDEAKL